MALFGKKKQAEEKPAETKETKNKKKKGSPQKSSKSNVSMNRKKKGHTLTISVKESATELMMDNKPFCIDGKTVGAATTISDAIGDLSNKKDTSIGQIVSYINHGTISAIVLDMLLEDDTIIIIPDQATVDTMRAYDSFKNAEYELCYVDLEEGTIKPCFEEETKLSFQQIENISNGRETLASILGIRSTQASGHTDSDDFDTPWDEDISDPLYAGSDDDIGDEFGDEFDGAGDEFDDFDVPGDEISSPDFPEQGDFDDMPDELPDAIPEPEPEPDYFAETTEETITQTMVRTFMVDDIEIPVSDEPFHMHFAELGLNLFAENRPTDEGDNITNHMNECLNAMAKDANADIRKAHETHMRELKATYMNALAEYVRTVINQELSTFGDTASAKERALIEEAHQSNLNHIDDEVNARKENIDREYADAIANVRKAAAENAEREYRENHQKQYVAQTDAIRTQVEEEIENRYVGDITAHNDKRRRLAMELLDEAIVNILDELTTRHADMEANEQEIYKKHADLMLEFLNDQRTSELDRIKVLRDEHARNNVEETLSAKHAAEIADITAKFNAQKKSLEADLQSMRENIDIAVNKATSDAERTINNLRVDNERLTGEAQRAKDQMEDADKRAAEKYKDEIDRLHNQINGWENEANKLHSTQKTYIFIVLGIALAATIAAGAIGFISGQSKAARDYAQNVKIETNAGDYSNNNNTGTSRIEQEENQHAQAPENSQPEAQQGTDGNSDEGNAPQSGSVTIQE